MTDDLDVTIGLADHQGTRVTASAARQVAGALLDAADRADADDAGESP